MITSNEPAWARSRPSANVAARVGSMRCARRPSRSKPASSGSSSTISTRMGTNDHITMETTERERHARPECSHVRSPTRPADARGAHPHRISGAPHASRGGRPAGDGERHDACGDRKSTRMNSSHVAISYAVFCLKKKKKKGGQDKVKSNRLR